MNKDIIHSYLYPLLLIKSYLDRNPRTEYGNIHKVKIYFYSSI